MIETDGRRQDRHHRLRLDRCRRSRKPAISWQKQACQPIILRVRAVPFTDEVERVHPRTTSAIYVVEMNRDGQLHQLLTLEYPELAHAADLACPHRWPAADRPAGCSDAILAQGGKITMTEQTDHSPTRPGKPGRLEQNRLPRQPQHTVPGLRAQLDRQPDHRRLL